MWVLGKTEGKMVSWEGYFFRGSEDFFVGGRGDDSQENSVAVLPQGVKTPPISAVMLSTPKR